MGILSRAFSGFARALVAPTPPVTQPPRVKDLQNETAVSNAERAKRRIEAAVPSARVTYVKHKDGSEVGQPLAPKSPVNFPPKGRFRIMRHGEIVTARDDQQKAINIAKSQRGSSVVDATTGKTVWVEVVDRPKGQLARIRAERARVTEAKLLDTGENIAWADLPRVIAQQALSPEARARLLPQLLTEQQRRRMERRFGHLDPKLLRLSTLVWQHRGMMRLPTGERVATETVSFWRGDRLCFNLATFVTQQEREKQAAELAALEAPAKEAARRAKLEARQQRREQAALEEAEKQRAVAEAEAKRKAEAEERKARRAAEAEAKKAAEEAELERLIEAEEAEKKRKAEAEEAELQRMIAEEEAAKNPPMKVEPPAPVVEEPKVEEVVAAPVVEEPKAVVEEHPVVVTEALRPVKVDEAPKLDAAGRGKCTVCGKRRKLVDGLCSEHQKSE